MEAHEKGIEDAVNRFYGDSSYPLKEHILNDMCEAIQAYLSASNQVLVPRNATQAMCLVDGPGDQNNYRDAEYASIWYKMVSVAPNPFKDK